MVNECLAPNVRNGRHSTICFCAQCRQHKVVVERHGRTERDLEARFFAEAGEYRRLNLLFEETLKNVIKGESYRAECLANSHVNTFGWWMRLQPRFQRLSEAECKKYARAVSDVHLVYRDWEQIVHNLTDPRMIHIDARKLSIHQLREARSYCWCVDYNELMRPPGDVPDDPWYDEVEFMHVINYIIARGFLVNAEYDPHRIAGFGRRIQRRLTTLCNHINNLNN